MAGTTTVTLSPGVSTHPQFIANHVEVIEVDTTGIKPNWGFSVDAAGFLVIKPRANSLTVEYPVLAGVIYPLDVVDVTLSSSTGPGAVYIHRQGL